MGIFNSYLLGSVKKSVGNLTMYVAKGVSIVRGKAMNVHNPRTEKQQKQRAKMKVLTELSSRFSTILSMSYPRTTGLVHASNRFVQDNMEAVQVDDEMKATVDFGQLTLSAGKLKSVKISVRCAENGETLTFTQTAQAQKLAVNPKDRAYVVAYEKEQKEADIFELKPRKEGGETVVDMPEEWQIGNCEFYAFVRNESGTLTSRTTRLTVTAG